MGEDSTIWAKALVSIWLSIAVACLVCILTVIWRYPKQYAEEKSKYETAIADGYKAVYDGNDMSEIEYKELANKYTMTYLPSQKKILLEKAERYEGRHIRRTPIIIPIIH